MIVAPWFNKILNPNSRAHYQVKATKRKLQKQDGYTLGKVCKKPLESNTYHLKITFNPPDNKQRDLDNCLASIKGLLDGLALAWGVNDKNFRPITIDFGEPVKNGSIQIEIIY